MPVKIDDVMKRMLSLAFSDGVPPLIGTATSSGRPQVSPKGTLSVFDDETLCYWERGYRSSYAAIQDNPQIVVYFRNQARAQEMPFRNGALRFHGIARPAANDAERDKVWNQSPAQEQGRDPERKGNAILIRVDLIEDLAGLVICQRD